MLHAHYKKTTGEIVSYGENARAEFPLGNIELPAGACLWDNNGQINKKVRLRDKKIVPLPVTLVNISRARILAGIAANTPKGDFVELGVYHGGSAWRLLEIANEQHRTLHLFDTFTGIPHVSEYDAVEYVGHWGDTDLEYVRELLPEAEFHVGIFPETLMDAVQQIAFIHFDMDVYPSAKAVKSHLWERVVPGGVIYFDDIDHEGVMKAIHEDFQQAQYSREMNMMFVVKER